MLTLDAVKFISPICTVAMGRFLGAHVCAHTHEAVHASQGKGAGSISSAPFIPRPETFVFKFHHIVQNLFCFNRPKPAAISSFV